MEVLIAARKDSKEIKSNEKKLYSEIYDGRMS
jgi:hypothetical protein